MNRRIVVVAGALAVAALAALLRPAVAPAPPAPLAPAIPRAAPDPAGPEASADGALRTPGPTVYVVGAVRHPGVFALPSGARIDAAVRAAGGLGPAADPVAIDLAAFARDGERIVVPRLGASPAPAIAETDGAGGAASDVASDGTAAAAPDAERPKRRRAHHRKRRRRHPRASVAPADEPGGASGAEVAAPAVPVAPVDINTADAATLATLPGVGEGLAERIVRFRETSGPFARPEELLDVNGMTQRTYDDIAPSIGI